MRALCPVVLMLTAQAAPAAAAPPHPCTPRAEAKKAAHAALHACIDAWAKDRSPAEADPPDTCGALLANFVAAARDVKACRTAYPR